MLTQPIQIKILFLLVLSTLLTQSFAAEKSSVVLCRMDERNQEAVDYCGTRPTGGKCQLEILLKEGLKKENWVLEIGCGTLMSAIPIMSFLEQGHYVGIEPNSWLIDASLLIQENQKIVDLQRPTFLKNYKFDATSTGIHFDYVFAHSIMSHAAHWQLPLFLKSCANVLKEGGKLVFSIRLTEQNGYGGEGASQETHAEEWVYPGCSFFHLQTVEQEALKWFRKAEYKLEHTALLTSDSKGVCHDWFVLTK